MTVPNGNKYLPLTMQTRRQRLTAMRLKAIAVVHADLLSRGPDDDDSTLHKLATGLVDSLPPAATRHDLVIIVRDLMQLLHPTSRQESNYIALNIVRWSRLIQQAYSHTSQQGLQVQSTH